MTIHVAGLPANSMPIKYANHIRPMRHNPILDRFFVQQIWNQLVKEYKTT